MKPGYLAATLALLAANAAGAAVITVEGAFTATDWFVWSGTPAAPLDPVRLRYAVTFDTDIEYLDETAPLTIIGTNVPYYIGFSYNPSINNRIMLATDGIIGGCGLDGNAFCAFVADFESGLPYYVYQSPPGGGAWEAGTIAAVPEPATWAMLIAGFGLVGAATRRRSGTSTTSVAA